MENPKEDKNQIEVLSAACDTNHSKREKATVYGVSIGNQIGLSFLFSFLGYYGVSLGAAPIEQSILVSTRNLGSNIFQTFWGKLADRIGRKPLIILGLFILAISILSAVMIVRSPLDLVLIVLFMTLFGYMFIPAWSAFLGDYSEAGNRGEFIGRVTSFGTYFSVPIILIVGLSMDFFFQGPKSGDLGAYWIPFGLSCTIFLISMAIAFFLNEKYIKPTDNRDPTTETISMVRLVRKNKPFSRLLTIDAFFKFSMSLAWPVFPYVALNVANSWFELSLLWAVFNFPRAVGQAYGGKSADRFGKKRVLMISRAVYFTVPALYFLGAITNAYIFLFLGGITGGTALGGEEVSLLSYSLDCSTEETKATYFSILLFTEGWVMFTGSIVAGILMSLLQAMGVGFEAVLLFMLAMIALLRITFAIFHIFLDPNPIPPVLNA